VRLRRSEIPREDRKADSLTTKEQVTEGTGKWGRCEGKGGAVLKTIHQKAGRGGKQREEGVEGEKRRTLWGKNDKEKFRRGEGINRGRVRNHMGGQQSSG